jgi:TolB-like protein
MLVERGGAPVSREELREALWPDMAFGDFERNLNSAIKRLRAALDDSGFAPRYVERLPKRGYRLLVPVVPLQADGMAALEAVRPPPIDEVVPARSWLRRVAAMVALAAVVGAGAYVYGRWSGDRAHAALRSIAVLPFTARSPDPGEGPEHLAVGLTEWVTYELAQLDGFRVAPTASARLSRQSGKSLAEIAKVLGVAVVLDGSIVQDSSRILITVQLIEASTSVRLWTGGYTRDSLSLTTQQEIAKHISRQVLMTITGQTNVLQLAPIVTEAVERARERVQTTSSTSRHPPAPLPPALAWRRPGGR